jgi:hypothetical protein
MENLATGGRLAAVVASFRVDPRSCTHNGDMRYRHGDMRYRNHPEARLVRDERQAGTSRDPSKASTGEPYLAPDLTRVV